MNRRLIGDQGLATAILHYTRCGHIVSVPTTEATRYDLVIDKEGQLLRVQVKTTTRRDGRDSYIVDLRTRGGARRTEADGQWVSPAECDLVFVLTGDGKAWELPVMVAAGRSELSLHVGRESFIVGEYPSVRTGIERPPHAARTVRDLPRGEEKGASKLTEQAVRDIQASPESSRIVGARYGVSHAAVGRIRKGQAWNHLDAVG
jgi:hypothetical protein